MGAISEQEKPAGELYYEAQMSSLEELYEECRENPDRDPFEWLLECVPLTEVDTYTDYDEETGEEVEHELETETVTGHKFLISWGGPESYLTTNNDGKTWIYHYNDWFGSDAFKRYLTGSQENMVNELFGVYFECLEDSDKLGAVRDVY